MLFNSIVYKNGSTHTIEDYADMAIRTASKRAYLMGEGSRRAEWGIRKVVVNSRIGACPRCGQYVGKVIIDDVYSGGSKADGGEPLLSEAIRGGLFHPRCKDSTSTYFEGITTLKPMTEEEMEEMDRREKEEARRSYHECEAEKNRRIADNSLDPDNKKAYAHRAEEHRKKATQIAEKPVANSGESGIIELPKTIRLDDIRIFRTLSARAKNYDVMDLISGEVYHIAEGTKIQNVQVFAGKGTRVTFRNAAKYAERYGGRLEDWQHVKGFCELATPEGNIKAEIHWVQCDGIGKKEFFVKEWLE